MVRELRVEVREALQRVPDALGDGLPRSFTCVGLPTGAATDAQGGGQLGGDHVHLHAGCLGPADVGVRLRLLEVLAQLEQSSAVRGAGAVIEHWFRGRAPADQRGSRSFAAVTGDRVRRRDEVGNVELASRAGDERGDVTKALRVRHANGAAQVGERPVVAFVVEHVRSSWLDFGLDHGDGLLDEVGPVVHPQ